MKEQFYPKWFKSDIELKQKKQLKNLFILSLLFIFISLVNIYNGLADIKEFKKINSESKEPIFQDETFIALNQFEFLYDTLKDKKESVKGLAILNDTIQLEIYAESIKEYGFMLKILEEAFIIEEVSPLIIEEGKGYFKVRMRSYEFV